MRRGGASRNVIFCLGIFCASEAMIWVCSCAVWKGVLWRPDLVTLALLVIEAIRTWSLLWSCSGLTFLRASSKVKASWSTNCVLPPLFVSCDFHKCLSLLLLFIGFRNVDRYWFCLPCSPLLFQKKKGILIVSYVIRLTLVTHNTARVT